MRACSNNKPPASAPRNKAMSTPRSRRLSSADFDQVVKSPKRKINVAVVTHGNKKSNVVRGNESLQSGLRFMHSSGGLTRQGVRHRFHAAFRPAAAPPAPGEWQPR